MVNHIDPVFTNEETEAHLKSHSWLQSCVSIPNPQTPHCARGTRYLKEEEILKRRKYFIFKNIEEERDDKETENLTLINLPCCPELGPLPAPYLNSEELWVLQGAACTSEAVMCVLTRMTCRRTLWNSAIKGNQPLNKMLNSVVSKKWVK